MPHPMFHPFHWFLPALTAVLLVFGCANPSSTAMQQVIESWQSASIDQAKAQWGPPDSVSTVPGGTAYLWNDYVALPASAGDAPDPARTPTRAGQCQRRLIANPAGTISRGDWTGNACCFTVSFGSCAKLPNAKRE